MVSPLLFRIIDKNSADDKIYEGNEKDVPKEIDHNKSKEDHEEKHNDKDNDEDEGTVMILNSE